VKYLANFVDAIANVRAPAAKIDRDVPVTGMGRCDDGREALIVTAVVIKSSAAAIRTKVHVIGEHDVALSVAIDGDGLTIFEVLAGVNESHVTFLSRENVFLMREKSYRARD
jgi:hypothetical protein